MTFVTNNTKIRAIRQGDNDFYISDGVKISPRAYIEISDACSPNLKLAIHKAMADGYLKAVACVKEKDFMWEKLSG